MAIVIPLINIAFNKICPICGADIEKTERFCFACKDLYYQIERILFQKANTSNNNNLKITASRQIIEQLLKQAQKDGWVQDWFFCNLNTYYKYKIKLSNSETVELDIFCCPNQ